MGDLGSSKLNATWLTEKRPKEEDWTRIIGDFFTESRKIPLSCSIELGRAMKAFTRQECDWMEIGRCHFFVEPGRRRPFTTAFLQKNFLNFCNVEIASCKDDAGNETWRIQPDMLDFDAKVRKVELIENKPLYGSKLTGDQNAGTPNAPSAYVHFCQWLRKNEVEAHYWVIASLGCCPTLHNQMHRVQEVLTTKVFGILLLEDIFEAMANARWSTPLLPGFDDWRTYTDLTGLV